MSDSSYRYPLEDASEEQFWEPPEADPCIKIPGEPILAQTKKGDVYWPAKVLSYIPPRKRNEEGKYRVLFLDNAERFIHRARFYIAEDDEFGTCKVCQTYIIHRRLVVTRQTSLGSSLVNLMKLRRTKTS